jgi:hypothetical protein
MRTQTMPNPSHKLRLVRMAVGHNASSRCAAPLHAGGSGGASGVWPNLRNHHNSQCSVLIVFIPYRRNVTCRAAWRTKCRCDPHTWATGLSPHVLAEWMQERTISWRIWRQIVRPLCWRRGVVATRQRTARTVSRCTSLTHCTLSPSALLACEQTMYATPLPATHDLTRCGWTDVRSAAYTYGAVWLGAQRTYTCAA